MSAFLNDNSHTVSTCVGTILCKRQKDNDTYGCIGRKGSENSVFLVKTIENRRKIEDNTDFLRIAAYAAQGD